MSVSFSSRADAMRWAKQQPRGEGRVYMVLFKPFTKIGSSQHFAGRLSNLVSIGEACRMEPECIMVGPVHPDYRKIEFELHAALNGFPKHHSDWGELKEWYKRSATLEGLVCGYIQEGYSETLLPAIIEAARLHAGPTPPPPEDFTMIRVSRAVVHRLNVAKAMLGESQQQVADRLFTEAMDAAGVPHPQPTQPTP